MNIDKYTTYDLPVPYKKILIYPVTVQDYFAFMTYAECLMTEKNFIPDIKVISMTELEYLYYATQQDMEKTPYILQFDRLLSLCLKEDKSFEKIEKSIERYEEKNGKPFFIIGDEEYDSNDYAELKKIICEQNSLELPDPTISKEVRDSLEEARKYRQKITGTMPASFEDYMISFATATGWSLEYIYSMTVRKFIKSVRRLDNLIHYKIYLAASMSGMVEFKDKSFIKHWLTNIDDSDKYSDESMDLDTMKEKISMESAKKK